MSNALSLSEEMLTLTRCAARQMGPGFARAMAFVRSRLNPDGGFAGRDGRSDLYYTAFALDALAAGGAAELPASVAVFVRAVEDVAHFDLAHLACLVRCWERLNLLADPALASRFTAVRARLAQHRTPSGGFSTVEGAAAPSVAGAFFALSILDGIGMMSPETDAVGASLAALRTVDGAYANMPGLAVGTVPAAAGAQLIRSRSGLPPEPEVLDWLRHRHRPDGGFPASPASPAADLLSTSSALYALRLSSEPLPRTIIEGCTEFLDGLMEDNGGFGGHWLDDTPDCEYTFHALLAYGCLAGRPNNSRYGAIRPPHRGGFVAPAVLLDGFDGAMLNASVATTRATLRARLLDAFDDGAGHWVGRLSDSALATAVAAFALAAVDSRLHADAITRALAWLAAHANEDGGWGDSPTSPSNISTTLLVWCAFARIHPGVATGCFDQTVNQAERWIADRAGGLDADSLRMAILRRYGNDRTFATPILTMCALAGRLGPKRLAWSLVPQLPFELAALPHTCFKWLKMTVVSYALPALICVGLVRHRMAPTRNPAVRGLRNCLEARLLRIVQRMQPANGGFEEAAPLTAFVVLSLAAAGHAKHPVVARGVSFLRTTMRAEGCWPIDTNLATWVTTLAVNTLARGGEPPLADARRAAVHDWLLGQQHTAAHPLTFGAPGGWAWSDLPGAMPDADDTAGALLALRHLGASGERERLAAARGIRWLLGIQNRDGGMPTFSKGWGKLPFDRSTAEIAAHTVEAFVAWLDVVPGELQRAMTVAIARMLRYLTRVQTPAGAWMPLWFGSQSVAGEANPVHGTARVILALRAVVAHPVGQAAGPLLARAERWLADAQRTDGGWGADKNAPPTIEDTGLAVAALAGGGWDDAVQAGVQWLASATRQGAQTPASPIGLYFARLWYDEALYPLIFALAGLGMPRANRQTGMSASPCGTEPENRSGRLPE